MIIAHIMGGIGNQLWQYAAGLRLASKCNTQLKLDLNHFDIDKFRSYDLNKFNITATVATPEEIQRVKQIAAQKNLGIEKPPYEFTPEVLDYPDNVWLYGYWQYEKYIADVADILHKEFTLKKLGATAQHWQDKIRAAECSVSLHVRHEDFAYHPEVAKSENAAILPLDYYRECVNRLKQDYPNLTVFVFSNNLRWCRENLRLNVPTEFIYGGGLSDVEELHLMSVCKHNIIANSTFSWWGAWLNQNPDKKVFVPIKQTIIGTKKTYCHFSAERDENSPLDSDRWIRVPFDINNRPDIELCPWLSLLLVVNNDAATLPETLESILAQDYKYYEIIIIDNASFDGSGKICRQAAKNSDKVTMIRLYNKISNGAAWNMAFNIAQGRFVMFLKGGDKIFPDALTSLYPKVNIIENVAYSLLWLRENERGTIEIADKKFSIEKDTILRDLEESSDKSAVISEILSGNKIIAPLATKIFNRQFLKDHALRFNEQVADKNAELMFIIDAIIQAEGMLFFADIFYVAPPKI